MQQGSWIRKSKKRKRERDGPAEMLPDRYGKGGGRRKGRRRKTRKKKKWKERRERVVEAGRASITLASQRVAMGG